MRTMTRVFLMMSVAALVLAIPAVSLGDPVRIRATSDRTWNPAFKSVAKGTKVVWKNPTGTKHTVTAYGSNWDKDTVIRAGERTSKIFRRGGAFYYRCKIHSTLSGSTCNGMCGHVHVTS
jgi:plastocyanin